MTRAVVGQYRMDITPMIHHTLRLRIESATMPKGRIGTPYTTSVTRMSAVSTAPPR